MKKAASIWCFPGNTSPGEAFDIAKRAGFDGVELSLDENGPLGLTCSEADLAAIKKQADDAGIELFSLATTLFWKYPLTSPDKAVREKAKGIVKKQLACAKSLGCDTILVVPGLVTDGDNAVSYDDAWNRSLEALTELRQEAERLEVVIGVENVWNKFLLSPLEMRNFIDEIDSEFVGAYFDVGNVIAFGYPQQWIRTLGDRICKVHFKDYRAAGGDAGFVDLLNGDVNWPEVMRALREVGYDGYVTAELAPYPHHPLHLLQTTASAMQCIIENR